METIADIMRRVREDLAKIEGEPKDVRLRIAGRLRGVGESIVDLDRARAEACFMVADLLQRGTFHHTFGSLQ